MHAGPLKPGQLIRAAIVSRTFPVAMAAAEVVGAQAELAHDVAYDAFSGTGERVLVVTFDEGAGPVVIDKLPLMLSSGHVMAEVWARVKPSGAVDVSWQLLTHDPNVVVTAQGSALTVANLSERGLSTVRRSVLFPGTPLLKVCPSPLDMGSGSKGPIEQSSICVTAPGSGRARLVLGRSDGAQLLTTTEVSVSERETSVMAAFSVAELSTRVGADGALALTAPDGTRACACEGTVIGREQVTLIRAEAECVLVKYPDESQRCLEAQVDL